MACTDLLQKEQERELEEGEKEVKKPELTRTIQKTDGNFDCYGSEPLVLRPEEELRDIHNGFEPLLLVKG
jgi:hypothetical protein